MNIASASSVVVWIVSLRKIWRSPNPRYLWIPLETAWLYFRLNTSRLWENRFLVLLSHPVCGTFYASPRKQTHPPPSAGFRTSDLEHSRALRNLPSGRQLTYEKRPSLYFVSHLCIFFCLQIFSLNSGYVFR